MHTGALVLQPGVNTLTFWVNPLKRGLYALKGVQARVGRAHIAVPVEPQQYELGRVPRILQRSASDASGARVEHPRSCPLMEHGMQVTDPNLRHETMMWVGSTHADLSQTM